MSDDYYDDKATEAWQSPHHWRVILEVDVPSPNLAGMDVKGPAIIGRSNPQSSTLPDLDLSPFGASVNGISRRHAVLIPDSGGVFLVDLGSTNGTWVNGKFLKPGHKYMLEPNDEIEFGLLKAQVKLVALLHDSDGTGFNTNVTRPKPEKE